MTAIPQLQHEQLDAAVRDAASAETPSMFTIAGRTFRVATGELSVDQDAYVMARLRNSRIATALADFHPERDSLLVLNERIFFEAFESGVMYELLGGLLVEDGVEWSRQTAQQTAWLIRTLRNRDEKGVIFAHAANVLIDFFRAAAIWSKTSQSFSWDPTTIDRGDNASNASSASNASANSSDASSDSEATRAATTASGIDSSES